ncbi:hypothetical protein Q8A67_000078 [Cirrhinus molitorella]|uniref:Uncharacterized protein n=1 Tax=Cirrhinus molitorella TaxID=172907 RepID=A0AA88QIY2_9TELE|nr:hypothetical protein Q8A67_000078 [Cirrhinus molitorella]
MVYPSLRSMVYSAVVADTLSVCRKHHKDSSTTCKMSLCKKIEEEEDEDVHTNKAASPEPSCVSMKSDASMGIQPNLSDGAVTSGPDLSEQRKEEFSAQKRKATSAAARCVSTKKCRSMHYPPEVSGGAVTLDPKLKRDDVIRSVAPCLPFTNADCQTLIMQRVKDQHKTSMKNNSEFKPLTPERAGSELQSPRTIISQAALRSKLQTGQTQCGSWRRDQDYSRTKEICM